jgi:hypothetical protein
MKYYYIISVLNKLGYRILCVNFDGDIRYYVVYKFQPDYKNTVENINYCKFQGVDITDFINVNQQTNVSTDAIATTFEAKFINSEVMNCQFNKDFKWIYWPIEF